MKNRIEVNKGVFIWIFICVIVNFLFVHGIGNVTLYTIVMLTLSLYFFPVKPILEIFRQKCNLKTIVFLILSNFVLASILSLMVIGVYLERNNSIEILSSFFSLANALLAIYNLFIKDDKDAAFLHFVFISFLFV